MSDTIRVSPWRYNQLLHAIGDWWLYAQGWDNPPASPTAMLEQSRRIWELFPPHEPKV